MLRKGVIYKYTFPNGKVYIGQTRRDPMTRHQEHLDPNIGPANKAFWTAYQEQGEPKYEILESYESEDIEELVNILNERETYYIREYKATDPNFGYNKVPYGMVPGRLRKKIYEYCQKLNVEFYEYNRPIWESMVSKIQCIEQMTAEERELYDFYFVEINPFYHEGTTDEFIMDEWHDFAEVSFKSDIEDEVCEIIQENFDYIQEEYESEDTIYQLDLEGNIIAKYENQADAATALGLKNSANINNVICGKQNTAHGYKWVKAKDYKPTTQLTLWD